MAIEGETEADWWAVEALLDTCFAPGRTALSSYRLRDGVPMARALCVLWRDPPSGDVAGSVRFWPVNVGLSNVGGGRAGLAPALLLGPVAVHPTRQGEGIAGALIREGLARAEAAGWTRVLLVGDPPLYARYGFARLDGVTMPSPTNPDRVLGRGDWRGVSGPVGRAA